MNLYIPFFTLFSLYLISLQVWAKTLPPCPSNKPVESWTNCTGTYIDSIGGKYVGGWKNGKFHGHGVTTFGEKSRWAGDKYVGRWKEGKKYGQGTYSYADESTKEGIWFNDQFLYPKKSITPKSLTPKLPIIKPKKEEDVRNFPQCPEDKPPSEWTKCIGSHTEFNLEKVPPSVRIGAETYLITVLETDPATVDQVMIDLMTGVQQADETTENLVEMLSGYGGTYQGSWKEGKFHGKGVATFGKKTRWAKERYEGSFKDGKRHGKGTYIYKDGSKYVGEFSDGKWNGEGTLTNSFGDVYIGEFKDGKRHGNGTLSNKRGNTYTGTFINDVATGSGRLSKKPPVTEN